jgi:hypothetical protein
VTQPSILALAFEVNGKRLLELPLTGPELKHEACDPEDAGMRRRRELETDLLDERRKMSARVVCQADGLFANQNIVCRLTHPATIEFLKKHFPEAVTNQEESQT